MNSSAFTFFIAFLLVGPYTGSATAFLSISGGKRKAFKYSELHYSEPDGEMNAAIVTAPPLDIFSKEVYETKRDDIDIEPSSKDAAYEKQYSLASALNVQHRLLNDKGPNYPIQIIGHRGSPYKFLENTLPAFLHAAQVGSDGVELDVFLLKCGTLVVFHGSGGDEEPGLLHSYCGVEGSILDYTAEEARRLLTFNKHFDEFGCGPDAITHPEDAPNGLPHYCYVYTLEEILNSLRDHPEVPPNFTIKIELKGPGTAKPAVELVRRLNMEHRCHYSSFDHSRIEEVKLLDGNAITGALFADHVPDDFLEQCLAVGADEVHLKYDTCTYERVQASHMVGLSTMAWFRGPAGMTYDSLNKYFDVGSEDISMYRTVLLSGVRSVCVNKPDIMKKALEIIQRTSSHLPRM